MYSGGEMIWLNTISGNFEGGPEIVYYAGPSCSGTPYLKSRTGPGPDVMNRVFVGKTNAGNYHTFYKIVGFESTPFTTTSYREFNTVGGMGNCTNKSTTHLTYMSGVGPIPILEEVPKTSLQDLSHLAPLKVEADQ